MRRWKTTTTTTNSPKSPRLKIEIRGDNATNFNFTAFMMAVDTDTANLKMDPMFKSVVEYALPRNVSLSVASAIMAAVSRVKESSVAVVLQTGRR